MARGTVGRARCLVLAGLASLTGLTSQAGCAQTVAVPGCRCENTTVAAGVTAGERSDLAPGRVSCGPGDPATWRQTWVLEPRVEEVQCSASARRLLVGLDATGEERWRHPLEFSSGRHRLEEWVIGADPSAVVLSNLAVLAPATGEALFPAPTHPVPGEDRNVPDHSFEGPALFLASERIFFLFIANEKGLYRLDPAAGTKELLLPVELGVLGGGWTVEDLKLDPDRRHLHIAQRLAIRGPGAVAFAVYDLAERRLLCRETLSEGRYTKDPRLVVSGHGTVGLSYRDEAAREIVHVRCEWRE